MVGPDIKDLRVLLVGGKPHAVQVLRTVFGIVGLTKVVAAPSTMRALEHLQTQYFDAVFCDEFAEPVGGMPFSRAVRRSEGLLNPTVPLFFTCHGPRRKEVEAARNEGVTDVLARPISAATVRRKLLQAVARPRPFIVSSEFFGPDRRAKERGAWRGGERRTRQPRKIKMAKPADGDVTLL